MQNKKQSFFVFFLIFIFAFGLSKPVQAGFVSDILDIIKRIELVISRPIASEKPRAQFVKDEFPTDSITCGEKFTIEILNYEKPTVWLTQDITKDGQTLGRYNGEFPVPLTYTSNCSNDPGVYRHKFYFLNNGAKGEEIGSFTFTIYPKEGVKIPDPTPRTVPPETATPTPERRRPTPQPENTCSFRVNKTEFKIGETIEIDITSTPTSLDAFWFGTGITGKRGVYAGVTPFHLSYEFRIGDEGNYLRYAVIRDGLGNTVCETEKISIQVISSAPSPTFTSNVTPTKSPKSEGSSKPSFRPESAFGFSQEVYPWLEVDDAEEEAIRKQAKLLKSVGVSAVQVYLMRWSEVGLNSDRSVSPFPVHDKVNDLVVRVLSEEGITIHSEVFSHFKGTFESKEKNPDSSLFINVPANQVPPLSETVNRRLTRQFYSYVFRTVRRYPQIQSWGFINEADQYKIRDLIIMQNTFYDAVKSANSRALVGAASPTFPEAVAPREDLHSAIIKALGEGRDDPMRSYSYPDIYNFWKQFYSKTKYDTVQLHQLGVRYWKESGWKDDGFRRGNDGKEIFDPENSIRWQLLKKGVENIRSLTGDKIITSQVDVATDISINDPRYWPRVQNNFEEAASGKYGYNFLDLYQLKENFINWPNGQKQRTNETFVFDSNANPSPLYDSVKKIFGR